MLVQKLVKLLTYLLAILVKPQEVTEASLPNLPGTIVVFKPDTSESSISLCIDQLGRLSPEFKAQRSGHCIGVTGITAVQVRQKIGKAKSVAAIH